MPSLRNLTSRSPLAESRKARLDSRSRRRSKERTSVQKQDDPIGTVNVKASALNVRSGPGTNYDRIGGLTKGKAVQYYEVKDGWLRIAYGTGQGWISAAHTDYKPAEKPPETGLFDVVVSVNTHLNVRTGPGTSYDKIGELTNGTKVTVLEEKDGWYRFNYNGQEGWIFAEHTYKPGDASTAGQTAADYAKTLKDICVSQNWHYNNSKRKSDGYYDCSAFTHRCWYKAGVDFKWATAAGQAEKIAKANGEIKSKSQIQPGDLLFWSYKNNGRYRNISHTAIAIGGGRRIDAGKEPVREDSVGSPLMIGRPSVLIK